MAAVAKFELGDFVRAETVPYPDLYKTVEKIQMRVSAYIDPRDVYAYVLRFLDHYFEIQRGWFYETIDAQGHIALGLYYCPGRDAAFMVEYSDLGWIDCEWVKYPLQEMTRVE